MLRLGKYEEALIDMISYELPQQTMPIIGYIGFKPVYNE